MDRKLIELSFYASHHLFCIDAVSVPGFYDDERYEIIHRAANDGIIKSAEDCHFVEQLIDLFVTCWYPIYHRLDLPY